LTLADAVALSAVIGDLGRRLVAARRDHFGLSAWLPISRPDMLYR
jgi:hypothetical protein